MVAIDFKEMALSALVATSLVVVTAFATVLVVLYYVRRASANTPSGSGSTHSVGRGSWIAGEPDESSDGDEDTGATTRSREEVLIREIEEVVRRTTWADAQFLILEMIAHYRQGVHGDPQTKN
jgi:hypothetical protein